MANLMDLLQDQLGGSALELLAGQVGGGDRDKTSAAANMAMNVLMSAVSKSAAKPRGLSGLAGALDKDHDGSILDDLTGLLSGKKAQSKSADGMGILSHLLGGSVFNAVEAVSQSSGMDRNGSMNLLMKLAPVVLGVLGKQKKQQRMDNGGLLDFLNQSQQQVQQRNPKQGLISKILDKDGDGSAMDEIAGMGMKVLGGLFKK